MQRLPELDVMRATAIIFIVLFHVSLFLYDNSFTVYVKSFMTYLSYLGLGIFFFLSGYLLYEQGPILDALTFYKKRLRRIYPLYLAGLFVAWLTWDVMQIGVFRDHYTVTTLLIHAFSLQEVLRPIVTFQEIPVLWFISILMLYYLIYPFIRAQKGAEETLMAASTVFLIFLLLRIWFGVFFYRAFLFFAPFIAGIVSNQIHVFEQFKPKRIVISAMALAFVVTSAVFLLKLSPVKYFSEMSEYFFYLIIDIMMVACCYLFYFGARGIRSNIILGISIGSYIVFLIHLPIIDLLMQIFGQYVRSLYAVLLVSSIGIPFTIALSYWIQKKERNSFNNKKIS